MRRGLAGADQRRPEFHFVPSFLPCLLASLLSFLASFLPSFLEP